MQTNDETMNLKILIIICPCLQDILKIFVFI